MKKLTQQNKGITLIALVITIIVLLILAAVSIATLTGENGILTKATDAKENTEIAEEDEKVKLAIASAFNNQGKFDQDLFLKELENQGLSGEKDEDGNVIVKTSHKIYTIDKEGRLDLTSKPEDSWGTLASQITASNYGDPVAYDVDLDGDTGTNDWKIFYKDDNNNVFLIAADYLDYKKNERKIKWDETKLEKVYEDHEGAKYSLNWSGDNLPEVQIDGIDANLFEADLFNSADDGNGTKCVSALLNTNYWENFVNPSYKGHAKAIGSPTLEMWIKSWNAKEYKQLTIYTGEGCYGTTLNDSDPLELVGQPGYNDELYFPHSEGVNILDDIGCNEAEPETFAYWLASSLDYANAGLSSVRSTRYA